MGALTPLLRLRGVAKGPHEGPHLGGRRVGGGRGVTSAEVGGTELPPGPRSKGPRP